MTVTGLSHSVNRALELDPEPGADSMSSGYGVPSAATYTVPPPLLLVSTSATVEWPSTALEGPKATEPFGSRTPPRPVRRSATPSRFVTAWWLAGSSTHLPVRFWPGASGARYSGCPLR